MNRIKFFQRAVITSLLVPNTFVFLSMQGVDFRKNLIYSSSLLTLCLVFFFMFGKPLHPRKKKTQEERA